MKEYIKKRWLYIVSLIVTYGISLVLVIEKMVTVKEITSSTAINIGGLFLGLAYLGFFGKKVRTKIGDMKPSPIRTLCIGLSGCIPFAVVGCLLYVANNAFVGADVTAWCICGAVILGTILQVIEASINKEYLYNREIDEIAKREADIERRKAELIAGKEEV